jgi:hypothetical protein
MNKKYNYNILKHRTSSFLKNKVLFNLNQIEINKRTKARSVYNNDSDNFLKSNFQSTYFFLWNMDLKKQNFLKNSILLKESFDDINSNLSNITSNNNKILEIFNSFKIVKSRKLFFWINFFLKYFRYFYIFKFIFEFSFFSFFIIFLFTQGTFF